MAEQLSVQELYNQAFAYLQGKTNVFDARNIRLLLKRELYGEIGKVICAE